jgi:hypothetical protein
MDFVTSQQGEVGAEGEGGQADAGVGNGRGLAAKDAGLAGRPGALTVDPAPRFNEAKRASRGHATRPEVHRGASLWWGRLGPSMATLRGKIPSQAESATNK